MSEKEAFLDLDFGPSLEKYGIFLFMDTITDLSCKDAIEFIHNIILDKRNVWMLMRIRCLYY